MEPHISVLIPLYNVEKYISRCLDSILCQTFQNFEIIVVDDASTDNSLSIVKEYQQRDKRIKIIKKKSNEGLMMARKTGYENATGNYYFFCDSDDYLPTEALSSLYNSMKIVENDMIVGDMLFKYDTGGSRLNRRSEKAENVEQYRIALLNGVICSLCGILFKSELFKKFRYETFLNQNFSEDRILLYQILDRVKTISSVDTITYTYCINRDSMTMNRLSDKKLKEQFNALIWCYNWNNKYSTLYVDNNRWFLKYVSYYIECGYKSDVILADDKNIQHLVNLKNFIKYCGFRLSIHSYLCKYIPIYQKTCAYLRLQIRKLIAKS